MPQALPPRATALLLALAAGLLLLRLGQVPLLGPDEPRYARVAVEMQRAGEWVTPDPAGPALAREATALLLAGGRLLPALRRERRRRRACPAVLAALVLMGATALVGARLFGAAAGLHAGFVLGHLAPGLRLRAGRRRWTCCWPRA